LGVLEELRFTRPLSNAYSSPTLQSPTAEMDVCRRERQMHAPLWASAFSSGLQGSQPNTVVTAARSPKWNNS